MPNCPISRWDAKTGLEANTAAFGFADEKFVRRQTVALAAVE